MFRINGRVVTYTGACKRIENFFWNKNKRNAKLIIQVDSEKDEALIKIPTLICMVGPIDGHTPIRIEYNGNVDLFHNGSPDRFVAVSRACQYLIDMSEKVRIINSERALDVFPRPLFAELHELETDRDQAWANLCEFDATNYPSCTDHEDIEYGLQRTQYSYDRALDEIKDYRKREAKARDEMTAYLQRDATDEELSAYLDLLFDIRNGARLWALFESPEKFEKITVNIKEVAVWLAKYRCGRAVLEKEWLNRYPNRESHQCPGHSDLFATVQNEVKDLTDILIFSSKSGASVVEFH